MDLRVRRVQWVQPAPLITGAIKWGDANFAFVHVSALTGHTLWPPP
jgi:hypothetical protein